MAVLNSTSLEALVGHGIKPSGYRIEFAYAKDETQFADPRNAQWQEHLAVVQSITVSYGADAGVAQFFVWDPKAIDKNAIEKPEQWLVQPKNGDAVRIWVDDGSGETLAFKGTIRSVHDRRTTSGVIWTCEAISEISRLNEVHFTGDFNFRNDPVRPQPVFDADGTVHATTYTVKQIVEMILNFPDPWGGGGGAGGGSYFTAASFDWNGLDELERCGRFKPVNISYENQPKGQCIEDVLKKAGNFTFVYNPANDKIKIIELNRQCSSCGSQWPIKFANLDDDAKGAVVVYAPQYHVEEDNTEWTTRSTYNTVRIVTGKIRFYSGHFIIPETVTGGIDKEGVYVPDYHIVDDGHDTADEQKRRARNPDGANYRFVFPVNLGVRDARKLKRHFVGLPLYPNWNIFEDWYPAVIEIDDVLDPDPKPDGYDAQNYKGKAEYQPHCIGDHIAAGNKILGYHDHLHVYQAWAIKGVCKACHGWGLVKKVYQGDANEPELKLVAKGPDGQKRYMVEVSNYIFNPSDFGNPAADISKLEPFYGANGAPPSADDSALFGTEGYPLPWKNTCPVCRGVGYQPAYKIRSIDQELFRGRSTTATISPDATTLPADPDQTQSGPERWEEANNRLALELGPLIQVEVPINTSKVWLPKFVHRNKPYTRAMMPDADHANQQIEVPGSPADCLDKLPDGSNNQPDERKCKFPHPLKYVHNHKNLIGTPGVTVAVNDPPANGRRDKIVPHDWTCLVPFTTIQPSLPCDIDYQTGRVIFRQPLFIPCRKPYLTTQRTSDGKKIRVDRNGLLMTQAPGRGFYTADETGMPTGYWRPARVWMQFTYSRDRFYHQGLKGPFANNEIETITLEYTSPDNVKGQYAARAMMIDGCYCLEVRKVNPENNTSNVEMSANNRPVQKAYTESESRIEVTEQDFWKLPVAPLHDLAQQAWDEARLDANYDHVMGKAQTWQGTTPGELLVESMGWSAADHYGSAMRIKPHSWHLRDDRPRLLGLAVRRLDSGNDIQVTGSLTLAGLFHDIGGGLGWVNYPDKGKVVVKKVVYNFANGATAELELAREETRIGELPPDDKDRIHLIEQQVVELRRNMELQRVLDARWNTGKIESQVGGQVMAYLTGGG